MPNPEKNWRSYLSKLTSAAIDELAPLLSRKLVAQSASLLLPQQSFNRTRTALVRAAGAHIGAHSQIQGPIRFTGLVDTCELLTIGDHTVITGHLHCDLGAEIRIGSRVRIGHDVSLLTVSHAFEHEWLRSGTSEASPIEIGRRRLGSPHASPFCPKSALALEPWSRPARS